MPPVIAGGDQSDGLATRTYVPERHRLLPHPVLCNLQILKRFVNGSMAVGSGMHWMQADGLDRVRARYPLRLSAMPERI